MNEGNFKNYGLFHSFDFITLIAILFYVAYKSGQWFLQ